MLNNFGDVFENFDLTNYNTYGIHTYTSYFIKVNDKECLRKLMIYLKDKDIPYFILGGGSNIILPDNPFKGIIISLEKLNNIVIDKNVVKGECGINLNQLCIETVKSNLEGLHNLAGIPGTLGGALVGNAGANNSCIYDYLESIEILRNNEFITLNKEDIRYSYRDTIFKNNKDIIISAVFKLKDGNKEELLEIIKENRRKRQSNQPLEYKNAGSVFKNPEGNYAGKLIEEVGLKGYSINDAQVSEKHANFIINLGNATSKDIINLIEYIKDKVKKEKNIELELEQRIIVWE